MPDHQDRTSTFEKLRQQAETLIGQQADIAVENPTDILELIHELKVYQIELEIQNEELRRAQNELSTLEHEYESLYEFAPCAYITLSPEGIITRVNLTGITLLDANRGRIIGTSLSNYIADSHADAFYRARQTSATTGEKQSLELPLKSESGDPTWVRTDIDAGLDDAGKVLQWRITMVNITEQFRIQAQRNELEAKLQQARKMQSLGTLAGGIAHEFNNCLAIILGNLELAMDSAEGHDPVREYIDEAAAASNRAMKVVRQLLTFTRMNLENRKPVNLAPIVTGALKFIRSSIPANIEIVTELQDDLYPVKADETQIHQIIMNFCSNATDAMLVDGGLLKVGLSNTVLSQQDPRLNHTLRPGRYVQLTISDTGMGMDEGTRVQIFDPYFTTKELGKGTGMGLAVVHGIVENHGGAILVDSHPGKGSVFNLLFPECLEPVEKHAEVQADLIGGGERILFVDDQESIAKVARIQLRHMGYKVKSFNQPLEALKHFASAAEDFDLVITDMAMPRMTGEQLAGNMREVRPDIPVILCTGYSDRVVTDDMAKLGVQAILIKPYRKEILSKTIREVLAGGN